MSSSFSAYDFDDAPHTVTSTRYQSFIDLSPSPNSSYHTHTHRSSRTRSGSVGSENSTTPLHTQRSSIRINTNLMPPRGKPPLPTTPKPDLRRPTGVASSHPRYTSSSAPVTAVETSPRERPGDSGLLQDRPPTTNYLLPQERAELIRKSRKLTQLLGETPSPLAVTHSGLPGRVSGDEPPYRTERLWSRPNWAFRPNARSTDPVDAVHSHFMLSTSMDALSISERSLMGEVEGAETGEGKKTRDKSAGATDVIDSDSASFIDLSDDDSQSIRILSSYSFPSLPSSRPSDSQGIMRHAHPPEENRRRRREKIAKLHRFLGSRVPASLVLGLSDADDVLPALDHTAGNIHTGQPGRRRSSSAAEFKSNWFGPDDRVKEELDEREKAINVRRAVKMEKMFGVQPPQTLYHTRLSPKPKDRVPSTEHLTYSEHETIPSPSRNVNQSSYLNKGGKQSRHRAHSRSESVLPLLDPKASQSSDKRSSAVYMHCRYSLDSLGDIIERDDRESLAELHSILTNDQSGIEVPITSTRDDDTKTVRSERRLSLPSRSSSLSLASQFSSSGPSPEMISFQARRRQAAKLTHFFGVDYRDLIGNILESIERYVEEESHRGSLRPEEIQDLMVKLRNLRTKRTTAR